VPPGAFAAELDPRHYTGRSEAQVGEFLRDYLGPVVARAAGHAAPAEVEEVRV
jgi:uncharacterized protein YdbL (DUF1318 family)